MLHKIKLINYRGFQDFEMEFRPQLNLLVGDNDTGKSTVLEAVNLALTGRLRGRALANVLSPHLINRVAADKYRKSLTEQTKEQPPTLLVELYLHDSDEFAFLRGSNNAAMEDAPGLRIKAAFSPDFEEEYRELLREPGRILQVPTEYYRCEWTSFAGNAVTARRIPISTSLVDATTLRLTGGTDYHLQQLVTNHLTVGERALVSRAYREQQEQFSATEEIGKINSALADEAVVDGKTLTFALDNSQRGGWENFLVPHLDGLPVRFVGKGGQSVLKTLLALRKRAPISDIVLVEEPENHLSPGPLNRLIRQIESLCGERQCLITTHSSYVLNKLGLDSLILLGEQASCLLSELPADTLRYFKRLPGYDTLRLVLSRRVILVEGPSDELVVQRAYRDRHGCPPMERGVEVISVGMSHKRFLDIAVPLRKQVDVVRDNDSKDPEIIRSTFGEYLASDGVAVHTGEMADGPTLEPQLVASAGRTALNRVLGTDYDDDDDLAKHMLGNKTACALKVFETTETIKFPPYINDAVAAE